MCAPKREALFDRGSQLGRLDGTGARDQREVGEVRHPRVGARARHGVGVELLGDVGLDGVHAHRGRCDAREAERIASRKVLGLAKHGVAEGHVHAEGATVLLARQPTLRAEALAVVPHAVVLDVRVSVVGANGKDHEVRHVAQGGGSQPVEDAVGWAHHAQVDIFGGARPLDAQLHREAALERDGFAEL